MAFLLAPAHSAMFMRRRSVRRFAPISNAVAKSSAGRWIAEALLGVDRRRTMPTWTRNTLSRRLRQRPIPPSTSRKSSYSWIPLRTSASPTSVSQRSTFSKQQGRGCMSSRTDVAAAPSFLKGCWRLRANSRREMPIDCSNPPPRGAAIVFSSRVAFGSARIPRRYCVAIRRRKRALSLTRPCCSRIPGTRTRGEVVHIAALAGSIVGAIARTLPSARDGDRTRGAGPALTHSRGHSDRARCGLLRHGGSFGYTRTLRRLAQRSAS